MSDRVYTYNDSRTASPHIPMASAMTPAVMPMPLGSAAPPMPSFSPISLSQPSIRMQRDPPICPTDDDAILPRKDTAVPGVQAQTKTQPVDKKSWEYIVKSGLAGGMAGCAAKTVVAPLDRVKILFQASSPQFAKYAGSWTGVVIAMRDIFHQDGSRGLFRGHSATLLRIFPYAGIKFLAYEQIRARVITSREQETPVRRFVAGSLAGCVSVFFTYPLEVIRVRLAFETKNIGRGGIGYIVRKIYNEHPAPPRVPTNAAGGAVSAGAVSYSTLSATASNASASLAQATVPRYGVANFFRGFTPTLCGMLPYAGSSFLAHDTISDLLRHPLVADRTTIPGSADPNKHRSAKLVYWAELSAGGFAGFISQTVSYPLEVIRRRMQVGGVVGDGHRLRMGEVAGTIWRERGWRGFFVGLGIGYVKVVPMVAVSFFAYERCKWWLGI